MEKEKRQFEAMTGQVVESQFRKPRGEIREITPATDIGDTSW